MLVNNTHYWHDTSRVFIETPDTNSFGYESNRRLSFYLRLYYEYEYCKSVNGQCFYITFTYNNKSIPLLFGNPVFNYDHIRLITNGKISKILSRQYGSKLKYLCACESGDGGTPEHHERGIGNNPHYHFIFYVLPSSSDYKPISPVEFLGLCQEVWQGKRGFFPWKYARFGSVKEGKFGISVVSTNALKYVSKYCLKDEIQKDVELKVVNSYINQFLKQQFSFKYLKQYYYWLKCNDSSLTITKFCKYFDSDRFFSIRRTSLSPHYSLSQYFNSLKMGLNYQKPVMTQPLYMVSQFQHWFQTEVIPYLVEAKMIEFRKKYSGKMRCSKSLGIYGLKHVLDSDSNPHFKIFESDNVRVYKLPLYYTRHLYYNVFKCPVSGNPLYVLNSKGKNLKLCMLSQTIGTLYNNTLKNVNTLIDNGFTYHYKSDLFDPLVYAKSLKLSTDYLRIVYKYAVYSVVYRHRCYCSSTPIALSDKFDFHDILTDYDSFLSNDQFKIDYEIGTILQIFGRDISSSLFSFHPLFKDYFTIFEFLDSVNDFIKSYKSDIKKQEFKETAAHQKRISAYENA